MSDHYCNTCKFAKWDYDEGYGRTKIWFVTECGLKDEERKNIEEDIVADGGTVPEYDEGFGDTVECPYWQEAYYEDT